MAEDLSIIIPAYNESDRIEGFLDDIFRIFKMESEFPEIIVIDDGSTDNTLELIRKQKKDLKTIHHDRRKGYGASLKNGIRHANNQIICIIDADSTYSVNDILRLAYEAREYDMVIGERHDEAKRPKDHLLAKKAVEKILSSLFGVEVKDINSGLRIMKKDILMRYLDILPNGFSFTSSVTLIMLLKKFKIKYLPIKYDRRDEGSKVKRANFVAAFMWGYSKILCQYFLGKL